jgi:hypothetical protein
MPATGNHIPCITLSDHRSWICTAPSLVSTITDDGAAYEEVTQALCSLFKNLVFTLIENLFICKQGFKRTSCYDDSCVISGVLPPPTAGATKSWLLSRPYSLAVATLELLCIIICVPGYQGMPQTK